jgi:hypothetical protein
LLTDEDAKADDDDDDDQEIACVGAGLEGGFVNTKELHVMKSTQAMTSKEKEQWDEAVFEDQEIMVNTSVWLAVPRKDVPAGAIIVSSTLVVKKKSNGQYRAILIARGYEQIDGVHYDSTRIYSPVTNDATVRIVLVLSLIFGWAAEFIYVQGGFLCGNFKK